MSHTRTNSHIHPIARSSFDDTVRSISRHRPELSGSVADAFSDKPMFVHREPYENLDRVIQAAKQLVAAGRADERIRNLALQITSDLPVDRTGNPDRRNFDAMANAIYNWMKKNIAYVRDQHNVERLQSADVTVRLKSGDCDCMAILGAALMQSLGINTRFKLISTKQSKEPTHIFLQYFSPKKQTWIDFDTTLGNSIGRSVNAHIITHERIVALSDGGSPFGSDNNVNPKPDSFFEENRATETNPSKANLIGTVIKIGSFIGRGIKSIFGGGGRTKECKEAQDKVAKVFREVFTPLERWELCEKLNELEICKKGSSPESLAWEYTGAQTCNVPKSNTGKLEWIKFVNKKLAEKQQEEQRKEQQKALVSSLNPFSSQSDTAADIGLGLITAMAAFQIYKKYKSKKQ